MNEDCNSASPRIGTGEFGHSGKNRITQIAWIAFFVLFCSLSFTSYAGPAPYGSIRVFVVDKAYAVEPQDSAQLRDVARIVISLTDVEAAAFWQELEWPEKMKMDDSLKTSEDKVYIIIDCYGRTNPYFTGQPDTLLCTFEKTYHPESGRFISTSHFVKILLKHLETIHPKSAEY